MLRAVWFQTREISNNQEHRRQHTEPRRMEPPTVPDASCFKTPRRTRLSASVLSPPRTPVNIPASPFMKKLGCGTGVNVYLMNRPGCQNQSPWAIKKINSRCGQTGVYQQRLCDEARVLKGLTHPNIVGFRAFTTAKDGTSCLAMEYGGERSLTDLIDARREAGLSAFPAQTIHKVALHVARGLQYLHNEKRLLHGDIKSCNVVVKGDFTTVKICDVGVSLALDDNMTVSDPKAEYIGTEPWSPKEALEGGVITDKADVYAYGLTLWEMMTLSMPHLEVLDQEEEEEEGESSDEEDFDEDEYYERLGTRPALDMAALGMDGAGLGSGGAYQCVVELFSLCTDEDPRKRPSASQIVQALEADAHRAQEAADNDVIVIDSD